MNRVSVLLPILLAFIVWAQANIDAPARSNFQGITKYYHPQPPPPPPPRCSGKDEEYYRELPFCNVYCEDIGKPCIPPTKPNNAGCGCRSGFSRWRPTGQCISHRDCASMTTSKLINFIESQFGLFYFQRNAVRRVARMRSTSTAVKLSPNLVNRYAV